MATLRTERIYCDEEERLRYGYRVALHYRFAPAAGGYRLQEAEAKAEDGSVVLHLTYAPTASLWRVNHGWRRGRHLGFTLDTRDGYWTKRPDDLTDLEPEGEEAVQITGLRPYVEDTRNLLLVRPSAEVSEEALATLQYAIQKGMAAAFQVEDDEIGTERVGSGDWRSMLFWEAAEGGLGVFRFLTEDAHLLSETARAALDVCHFDPETGEDRRPAGEADACVRACYDCLLSYANQPDHLALNRHLVRELLLSLARGIVQPLTSVRDRHAHYEWLRPQVDERSALERDALELLYREGYRLPEHAQWRPQADVACTPDFFFEPNACLFCDGPHHDEESQRQTDALLRARLEERGYLVLVVRYDQPVGEQIKRLAGRYPSIFKEDWR